MNNSIFMAEWQKLRRLCALTLDQLKGRVEVHATTHHGQPHLFCTVGVGRLRTTKLTDKTSNDGAGHSAGGNAQTAAGLREAKAMGTAYSLETTDVATLLAALPALLAPFVPPPPPPTPAPAPAPATAPATAKSSTTTGSRRKSSTSATPTASASTEIDNNNRTPPVPANVPSYTGPAQSAGVAYTTEQMNDLITALHAMTVLLRIPTLIAESGPVFMSTLSNRNWALRAALGQTLHGIVAHTLRSGAARLAGAGHHHHHHHHHHHEGMIHPEPSSAPKRSKKGPEKKNQNQNQNQNQMQDEKTVAMDNAHASTSYVSQCSTLMAHGVIALRHLLVWWAPSVPETLLTSLHRGDAMQSEAWELVAAGVVAAEEEGRRKGASWIQLLVETPVTMAQWTIQSLIWEDGGRNRSGPLARTIARNGRLTTDCLTSMVAVGDFYASLLELPIACEQVCM